MSDRRDLRAVNAGFLDEIVPDRRCPPFRELYVVCICAQTIRWLFTGDMAKQDEEGFIFLVDRKKDLIICGGENVFPVEVEDFLHTHPGVKDVAAIGIPDERMGELVTVVIDTVPGKALTEEDVLKYCEKLPKYKRPRKVFFGEVLRNPTGKIEKPKLRKKYIGMEESFKIK
jgi:acyl-CoA synthetase (AMP-forming)/AMP-acid ligase II